MTNLIDLVCDEIKDMKLLKFSMKNLPTGTIIRNRKQES